jgi:hypothetical protein
MLAITSSEMEYFGNAILVYFTHTDVLEGISSTQNELKGYSIVTHTS